MESAPRVGAVLKVVGLSWRKLGAGYYEARGKDGVRYEMEDITSDLSPSDRHRGERRRWVLRVDSVATDTGSTRGEVQYFAEMYHEQNLQSRSKGKVSPAFGSYYNEGYEAQRAGLPRSSCRYQAGSANKLEREAEIAWQRGWNDSQANKPREYLALSQKSDTRVGAVLVKSKLPSDDSLSHDEWASNADRVSQNPEGSSSTDLRRAIGYYDKLATHLRHRGKNDAASSVQVEIDHFKRILRDREKRIGAVLLKESVGKALVGAVLVKSDKDAASMRAAIGFVVGTGRTNHNTEQAIADYLGTDYLDVAAFPRYIRSASANVLRDILGIIRRYQPESLPASHRA